MRRTICALLLSLPLLGACTPAQIAEVKQYFRTHPSSVTTRTVPDGKCYEDMPCFNCHTHGNGVCGPVWVDLAARVVHARNGTFPFTEITWQGANTATGAPWACVSGKRPIPPFDHYPLACGVTHA